MAVRYAAMDDLEKNGNKGSRSKSFTFKRDTPAHSSSRHKTLSPMILARLKKGSVKKRSTIDESEPDSGTPLDDLICLDSYFEELNDGDDSTIIITKDAIKNALQELLKNSSGPSDILSDLAQPGKITNENADKIFSTHSHSDRNVAFLAAALYDRHDLLQVLFGKGVDEAFHEPKLGLGALHISAFSGSQSFAEALINAGFNVNALHGTYTPLHCAALGDNVDIARGLLKAGAHLGKAIANGQSPLHSAIHARSHTCLKLFVEANADVNMADSCGFTPLHLAADLGDFESARILLDSGLCDVQLVTRSDENTPLHLAAQGGCSDVVKILLEKGSSHNARNARYKTPLHLSSRGCLESTELLLRGGADPNAADADQRTSLHTAVSRSEIRFGPEITTLLLYWKADVNKQDRYGYTPLHIAALNELTECVQCLIKHGADISAKTKGGTAALGLIARKTPSALPAIEQQLDAGIFCSDPEVSHREVKLSFNFRYILQGCARGDMNFLQTFVNEGQRQFLEHPLCEAFLHIKWEKIRKYYAFRLIFCFLLVLLFSIYSLTALAYQCYNTKIEKEDEFIQNRIAPPVFNASLCSNKSRVGLWLRENPEAIEVEWCVLMFFTILEIARKIYGVQGYKSVREYFSLGNIVEWFFVVAVFATSYVFTGNTTTWQNHVGAFAVLFGWANLMVIIGHLPMFGSYVAMYTKVQKEFAKLLSAYICILIGFTFCFCAIFVQTDEFDNPLIGFIKVLVMMTGEFEFGELLKKIDNEQARIKLDSGTNGLYQYYFLQVSALVMFVLFLLFVTVILINLLIGIAVDDIQGLKKTARLSKLVGLTKLISHIESALFGPRVPGWVHKLLNASCGIARVVESVRPLNSRENRLPREIMRVSLEIARQAKGKRCDDKIPGRQSATLRRDTEQCPNELVDMMAVLTAEVAELKQLVMSLKR